MAPRKGQKHSGQFDKGQSGNPGGRPKLAEGWRQSIREDEELRDLARRAAKGQLTHEERVKIDRDLLKYHLDQGFGRASQQLEHTAKDGEKLDFGAERFEEALRRIAGLKK